MQILIICILIILLPTMIKIVRIIHLKHLGTEYIGNGRYEEIGNKKYKWYEWLR